MVKISNDLHAFEIVLRVYCTMQEDADKQVVRSLIELGKLLEQKIGDSIQTDYIKMMVQQSIESSREDYGVDITKEKLHNFVTRNGFYDFKSINIRVKDVAFRDLIEKDKTRFMESVERMEAETGYPVEKPIVEDRCGIYQYSMMADDKELLQVEAITNDFVPYESGEVDHQI